MANTDNRQQKHVPHAQVRLSGSFPDRDSPVSRSSIIFMYEGLMQGDDAGDKVQNVLRIGQKLNNGSR